MGRKARFRPNLLLKEIVHHLFQNGVFQDLDAAEGGRPELQISRGDNCLAQVPEFSRESAGPEAP